jgi:hypothetical protein
MVREAEPSEIADPSIGSSDDIAMADPVLGFCPRCKNSPDPSALY